MANTLDSYVKNVISFTSIDSGRELVELNRKAIVDVLEKNVLALNQILEMLSPESHSLSFVSILLVKLNHACNSHNAEKVEETLSQIEISVPFFSKSQLLLAPDIFVKLFRKVFLLFLQPAQLLPRGITILANATSAISEPGELVSLHSCLFCLCLKAKLFEPALSFLQIPISKILRETTSEKADRGYMDSRWVLQYFYYGGLIYGALGRLENCLLMMQNVLCVPAAAVSAIMIQAYKKFLLLSLILHGSVKSLPGFRAVIVPRLSKRYCYEYQILNSFCTDSAQDDDVAKGILTHLNRNLNLFQRDGNVGLVKRLARKVREDSIVKVSKTFLTVSMADLVHRCYLESSEHAERYIADMNAEGKICATVDKEKDLVHFEEPQVKVDEDTLDAVIESSMQLASSLKAYDTRIRTNPLYVARSAKSSSAFMSHDDEGFQQGPSGFQATAQYVSSAFAAPTMPSFELNLPS